MDDTAAEQRHGYGRVKERRERVSAPVYNGELPKLPMIDLPKVLDEIRQKTDIYYLAERMGLPTRALDHSIRTGKVHKSIGFYEFLMLLRLHRKFYPQGTEVLLCGADTSI